MVTFANGLSEVQCNIILYYTHLSELNQTKRRHHRTYTVDEADALGLAIPWPQGAMGAVGRHGHCSERSPKLGGDFRTAVRCDTWYLLYVPYRRNRTDVRKPPSIWYEFNPFCAPSLIFTVGTYYSYVVVRPPILTHDWPEKPANHGARRKWPLAPPTPGGHPN